MSLTTLLIWILLAALVGVVGELLAHRRAPDGLVGAILLGFLAILLVNGIFHISIKGEPVFYGVPIITSIIAAAILVLIWSAFAYHHVHRYYSRGYYRRGSYVRRPRRRFRLF